MQKKTINVNKNKGLFLKLIELIFSKKGFDKISQHIIQIKKEKEHRNDTLLIINNRKNTITNNDRNKFIIENFEELKALMGPAICLTDSEIRTLAKYSQLTTSPILEIGSAYGASSSVLIIHSKPGTKVFSIDPFVKDSKGSFTASSKICKKNVKKVLSSLKMHIKIKDWKLITDYSYNVIAQWKLMTGMIFIDGDHRYESVKIDYEDWLPYLHKGGFLLLHDSCKKNILSDKVYNHGWAGPSKLAREMKKDKRVKYIGSSSSITIWKKE